MTAPSECKVMPPPANGVHNYSTYTRGGDCDDCRKAKAEYMAARRAAAKEAVQADPHRVVYTPSHGTRYAYEELGCRCEKCVVGEIEANRLRAWRAWQVAA